MQVINQQKWLLLAAVLMLGMVSQIAQVLFMREMLMVFHGNELSIGIILAAWLTWVGMGSMIGAYVSERSKLTVPLFSASTAGILITLPSTLLLIRFLRYIFGLPPGAYFSLPEIMLSSFTIMAPTCLLLGIQFILLARIWRESVGSTETTPAGKIYTGEAAGNMLGGLCFTLLLVHQLDTFQLALLISLFWLAIGAFMMTANLPERSPPLLLIIAATMFLIAAITLFFPSSFNQWAARKQWHYFSPQHELIQTYQSKYGTISVLGYADQYSFFQSGHLVFSVAGPDTDQPAIEEQDAVNFAHLAMLQHKNPEKVLLIGGGLRGMLKEMIKHPVSQVDYIELDQVLTEAALPYTSKATLEALSDNRVTLIHTDGRLFVKTTQAQYDLIIIDSPDPATAVLNRYYTREFFLEAEKLLKPDGVLITGIISTPDLRGRAITNRNATIYHTLKSVYNHVFAAGEHFLFFLATNQPGHVSLDPGILEGRYRQRNIESEGFSAHHFQTLLYEPTLKRVNWILSNHGRSDSAHLLEPETGPLFPPSLTEQESASEALPPVNEAYFINSDFKPIAYYYSLMFWDNLTRPNAGDTFHSLLKVKPHSFLPILLLPLILIIVLKFPEIRSRNRSHKNFAILYAVFTTGFSTMAMQIALLFSFQSIYGFVYEMVGLIIAFFMGGLSLGAYLGNHHLKKKNSLKLFAALQLAIAFLAFVFAVLLPPAAAVNSALLLFAFFTLLTFSAGLINGLDFPVAMACYLSLGKSAEKTAGFVYGIELFGACFGAILASAFIVPVQGIVACCYFAAVANASAFIIIYMAGRS